MPRTAAMSRRRPTNPETSLGSLEIGISESCLRNWTAQADADEKGSVARLSITEKKELAELCKRNRQLEMVLRTCAAWRPDADAFRDPVTATRIAIKSLCQRILDLHDEIGLFDQQIAALVDEIVPN